MKLMTLEGLASKEKLMTSVAWKSLNLLILNKEGDLHNLEQYYLKSIATEAADSLLISTILKICRCDLPVNRAEKVNTLVSFSVYNNYNKKNIVSFAYTILIEFLIISFFKYAYIKFTSWWDYIPTYNRIWIPSYF